MNPLQNTISNAVPVLTFDIFRHDLMVLLYYCQKNNLSVYTHIYMTINKFENDIFLIIKKNCEKAKIHMTLPRRDKCISQLLLNYNNWLM